LIFAENDTRKAFFFDDLNIRLIAYSGQDIIDKLETNHNIDIILMDLEMLIIDGIEATLHVKSNIHKLKYWSLLFSTMMKIYLTL